jgi:hypothetical protein
MDLVICEIFNKKIHGFDENNDPTVLGHYIVSYNFTKISSDSEDIDTEEDMEEDTEEDTDTDEDTDPEENTYENTDEYTKSVFNDTKFMLNLYKSKYNQLNNSMKNHSIIRNYKKIIAHQNYIQLHIAKVIYLSGSECVAILKTFWIKIIQRTWKKIYKTRCNIIALRKSHTSLFYRERHGKWPDNCLYLPSLQGLLSN